MRKQTILAAAVGALALGVAGFAFAGDATDSMQLTVNIESECIIDASDFSFAGGGASDTVGTNLSVNVLCNQGTPYTVGVDRGLNDGAYGDEPGMRALIATDGSGNSIPYELYQDVGATQLWGDIDSGLGYAAVGNGDWQLMPAQIRIHHVSMAPTGSYDDTVSATARF
ncbi:MAG: Csu type fimbrial protein [Luteimonas sp.]